MSKILNTFGRNLSKSRPAPAAKAAAARYRSLLSWVIVWRLIVMAQIPVMLIFCPERLGSNRAAIAVFLLCSSWAVIHFLIGRRPSAWNIDKLPVVDLLTCALLLYVTQQPKLIFITSFYSQSALMLLAYRYSLAGSIPGTMFISFAYLGSDWASGLPPLTALSQPNELGTFILYYFAGLGLAGFGNLIKRISSLELDAQLASERLAFRRYLHDYLGNTLSGLHLKLQSLNQASVSEVKTALARLAENYRHAGDVLSVLIGNLEYSQPEGLPAAMRQLEEEIKNQTGINLTLSLTQKRIRLSPEVTGEISSIIREAVYNAIKHSGSGEISIRIEKRRQRLTVEAVDAGEGFDPEAIAAKSLGKGIQGMSERATRIGAELRVDSTPGTGARVSLELKLPRRLGGFSRVLDYREEGGGLYPFLLKLQLIMLLFMLVQWQMLPPGDKYHWSLILITALLCINCMVWLLLRRPLYRLFSVKPQLLLIEQLFFASMFFLAVYFAMPVYFSLYMGVICILTGFFTGFKGNSIQGLLLTAGITCSYLVAPLLTAGHISAQNLEDMFTFDTGFIVICISGGMAGDFMLRLEQLHLKSLKRALAAQKEQLVHRLQAHLQDQLNRMAQSVESLATAATSIHHLEKLEDASAELKASLRQVINALDGDEPNQIITETAAADSAAGTNTRLGVSGSEIQA